MAQPRPPALTSTSSRRSQLSSSTRPFPRRRSSSVQDILETGRQRSQALSRSSTFNSERPQGTITLTQEEVQTLLDEQEFREWKRERNRRREEEGRMAEEPDEVTAIVGRESEGGRARSDYGTNANNSAPRASTVRSRPSTRSQASTVRQDAGQQNGSASGNGNAANGSTDRESSESDRASIWSKIKNTYGSLELENKGSVARDHLALERTFLAWLRTSLTFASIGIAITQLFRLNTSLSTAPPPDDGRLHMRSLGKPIGATFVGISIVVLFTGFHRYFESQHWILRGKFPASRGSIALITLIAFLLMAASFVVVLVVEPRKFEK